MSLKAKNNKSKKSIPEHKHEWSRNGFFNRHDDGKKVQKYLCAICGATRSDATLDLCYRQKKRTKNALIFGHLVSGVSQRRSAMLAQVSTKTVVRKFIFLGQRAAQALLQQNLKLPKASKVEFDDMETFEHTKMKPLSITLAVESPSRRILSFRVSEMPAKGLLAKRARIKYGPRRDERPQALVAIMGELKSLASESTLFKSDKNPFYPAPVQCHFPNSYHQTFKGRRGCVVGQGELKRGGFDPLFSLNHTCAKLRADINRLFRRTWCTTKKKERLAFHIALMAIFHNFTLEHKAKVAESFQDILQQELLSG